jgi:hypothetical protein
MEHLLRWIANETTVEDGRQLELAVYSERRPGEGLPASRKIG